MKEWFNNPNILVDLLTNYNSSLQAHNYVDKSERIFNALNIASNEYYKYRKKRGDYESEGDKRKFINLVKGLNNEEKKALLKSNQVKKLLNLRPLIMDDNVLEENKYNPEDIEDRLRKKASRKHYEFIKRYYELENYQVNIDDVIDDVIEWLSQVIYMVRCNLKHCGKTPYGPDKDKINRDLIVCQVVYPVGKLIIEILLDEPHNRLAVYGVLRPEEWPDSPLSKVEGKWIKGVTNGLIKNMDNYSCFTWDIKGEEISMDIFVSSKIPFDILDRFEGASYLRNLILFKVAGSLLVCNVYEENSFR